MLLRTELGGLAERAIAAERLVHGLADGLADGSVGARIGLLVQEEERDRLDRPNDVDVALTPAITASAQMLL